MPTIDPRVDADIAHRAGFARPIVEHRRAIVHAAGPDVDATMKRSFPHIQYQGILCSMATAVERIGEAKGRNWKYETC